MKFDYEYYTLKNGLRVFLMPSNTVNSATVTASVKSGSAHETNELSGITHFIEHLSHSSTESWPTRDALNEVREFTGSKYNASTSREGLNYWISSPYNQVDFAVKYIYELLYKCTLNPEYIDQERSIIIDEIAKTEDNPEYQNTRFISENLNKNNSGYVREIAGTKETVRAFTIDDIKSQYETLHSPNKVMISVVGNFEINQTKKLIEDLFGSQKQTDKQKEYPTEGIKSNIIKTKNSKKTDLILTSIEFESPSDHALTMIEKTHTSLLFSILSGPMSSRLTKRLRLKENLLYNISAYQSAMETFGYTSIYYEVPQNNFEKAFKATVEELERFQSEGTDEKELSHYREYFCNRYLINHDNVFSFSKLFTGPLFWGHKPMDLDEVVKVIRNSKVEDINKLIPSFINMERVNAFGFGNVKEDTEAIIRATLNGSRS